MANSIFSYLQTVLININAGTIFNIILCLLPFGIGKAFQRFLIEPMLERSPFSKPSELMLATLWFWAIVDALFLLVKGVLQ